ncbi:hypothetical protein BU14_0328s0028 [Porphyra umbilicalis]|uniref:Cyclic nucleotide-binding domain-containing protein n=1 Tax=Porphyra umbilicalis TaxID=2786 RepID=A0A1X6NZ33_PORUM|nr:hypothetical protein BU14_0328s0028 [Porphyra umbilicalis]|eukprot:OSX73776.1 hypothetical protein BU14_0328s0028 [Porphyra umbilicalis]
MRLVAAGSVVQLRRGDCLTTEGAPNGSLWLVTDGTVRVEVGGAAVARGLAAGSWVGERGFLRGQTLKSLNAACGRPAPAAATVQVESDRFTAIRWSRSALLALFTAHPSTRAAVTLAMTEDLLRKSTAGGAAVAAAEARAARWEEHERRAAAGRLRWRDGARNRALSDAWAEDAVAFAAAGGGGGGGCSAPRRPCCRRRRRRRRVGGGAAAAAPTPVATVAVGDAATAAAAAVGSIRGSGAHGGRKRPGARLGCCHPTAAARRRPWPQRGPAWPACGHAGPRGRPACIGRDRRVTPRRCLCARDRNAGAGGARRATCGRRPAVHAAFTRAPHPTRWGASRLVHAPTPPPHSRVVSPRRAPPPAATAAVCARRAVAATTASARPRCPPPCVTLCPSAQYHAWNRRVGGHARPHVALIVGCQPRVVAAPARLVEVGRPPSPPPPPPPPQYMPLVQRRGKRSKRYDPTGAKGAGTTLGPAHADSHHQPGDGHHLPPVRHARALHDGEP